MPKSVTIAAIDAGSNAIRMEVAQARSAQSIFTLRKIRRPIRLGQNVFIGGRRIGESVLRQSVRAFAGFAEEFDQYEVRDYRAVATSALREAANNFEVIERIYGETGILLEIVSGDEEARLIRAAVAHRLGEAARPGLITDLGGGSLELNLMNKTTGRLRQCITLPIGTVRLMESFGIRGVLAAAQAGKIRRRVQSLLRRTFPKTPDLSASITVACGGNAEALSRIAPGFTTRGVRTLDMPMLQQQAAEICRSSVLQRMRRYNVHRDRAEVMGIAAIVLLTLARRFKINFMLVPGVGVREGILCELARAHYQGGPS